MQAPPDRPSFPPTNLPEILKFLSIPYTFQIEKIFRKIWNKLTVYLVDGINDIPQVGFAVAMERRFHYELDEPFGQPFEGYYYLKASFLDNIGVVKEDADGIKIYFGLDIAKNRLIPILTQVIVKDAEENPDNDSQKAKDKPPYYIPTDAQNGDWEVISESECQTLRDNYATAVEEINSVVEFLAQLKYKTRGYYIGRDALRNVLSDKDPDLYDTTIVRQGIKIYFGIQEKLLYYNYETGYKIKIGETIGGEDLYKDSTGRDLHLILLGVDEPTAGPLASFSRVFATIETDEKGLVDGKWVNLGIDRLVNGGVPCVVPDPPQNA